MKLEPKREEYAISSTVRLGKKVVLSKWCNLYHCEIGDECHIGPFVEIQRNVRIGARCKISSHSFLCEGVFVGSEVFIGHGVIFTNDRYPQAVNEQGTLKKSDDWKCEVTVVEDEVSIGSGSIILPGIRIGRRSTIGAGSVVTKNVRSGATVVGNPARPVYKT
jgi:acetyltransferase-like isoleucine patch superfamily enzyme